MLGIEGASADDATQKQIKTELTDEEIELDLKNNVPEIIPIRCGTLTAKLHTNLFVCPGIHQHCIELDCEPDLITPKAFTIRANKDRQKDWKGSIRIGKSNLRTLMEMRTFDFHNHQTFCSAKCQSRNYITPKDREPSLLELERDEMLLRRASLPTIIPRTEVKPTLGALFKNPQFSQFIQLSQALRNNNNVGTSAGTSAGTSTESPSQAQPQSEKTSQLLSSIQQFTKDEQFRIGVETNALMTKMTTEPIVFWGEMQNLGISEQIIDQMVETLNLMRIKLKHGHIGNIAPLLSRSIASLGVCDRVVATIRRRNSISGTNVFHRLSTDYSTSEDIKPQSITEQLEALTKKAVTANPRKKSIANQLDMLAKRAKQQQEQQQQIDQIVKIEPPEISPEEPVSRKRALDEQLQELESKKAKIDEIMMNQMQSPSEILMQIAASINPPTPSVQPKAIK